MFPRISRSTKNNKLYEYLVISESVHTKGKGSTTRDIAKLGNIKQFNGQDIENIIDGLIKIFNIEKYSLSNEVEIVESLEYGSIIFWQKIWDELDLSKTIKKLVKKKDARVTLKVEKYVEMMVINRLINPLSKLGATRWIEGTCYKEMKGYSELSMDVTYFYRSMDHLLKIKDELELVIYKKLENLFSVNVKLTFYDITSSYFYTDNCPIGANGYSRDDKPDKEQIVIAVVTTFEGYPIKHYVFEGNTKDESTVCEVVRKLKTEYNIKETTFVGDRGMITKLNLRVIEEEGYDYIMGVKHRQDEICKIFFLQDRIEEKDYIEHNKLKIQEKKITIKEFLVWKIREILKENGIKIFEEKFNELENAIWNLTNKDEVTYKTYKNYLLGIMKEENNEVSKKLLSLLKKYKGRYEDELRYIICLNEERKVINKKRREKYISTISKALDELFSGKTKKLTNYEIEKKLAKIFEGYKSKYRKFFTILSGKQNKEAKGYELNTKNLEEEKKTDGIFILLTNRNDLDIIKVVETYKNLKEVEMLFDDLKHFVDIRPMRHWLEIRVRAHVSLCIFGLLLKRIFEINYLQSKCITEPLEEISKVKLVKYKVKFCEKSDKSTILSKITNVNPVQKQYFNMIGIRNPMSLERLVW